MARIAHNKKTHETFLREVKEILGEEYSVLSEYKTAKTKVLMRHSCGEVYQATPDKIKTRGDQCPKCKAKRAANTRINNTSAKFYNAFNEVASSEYELLSEYKGVGKYITVKHLECGFVYKVTPANFVHNGRRCPECMEIQRRESKSNKPEDIDNRLFAKFGGKISLAGRYNGYNEHSTFMCAECEVTFVTSVSSLLSENVVCGCPNCTKVSSGEEAIKTFLSEKKVSFKPQYTFSDLKHKHPLRFDFAILKDGESIPQLLIEFDGRQHYESVNFFGGDEAFALTKLRDELKNEYCKQNGIKLIRIPYWEYGNIENILAKEVSGF